MQQYGEKIAEKISIGFKNGVGYSSLEGILREFLENQNCGHFEIFKYEHPKDPKYPDLNELCISIENHPPTPVDELAPY